MLRRDDIEHLRNIIGKKKRLILHCNHCMRTMGKSYAEHSSLCKQKQIITNYFLVNEKKHTHASKIPAHLLQECGTYLKIAQEC